jgi:hypothetical protein
MASKPRRRTNRSDRYIWCDVRPDAQSLADALDELE